MPLWIISAIVQLELWIVFASIAIAEVVAISVPTNYANHRPIYRIAPHLDKQRFACVRDAYEVSTVLVVTLAVVRGYVRLGVVLVGVRSPPPCAVSPHGGRLIVGDDIVLLLVIKTLCICLGRVVNRHKVLFVSDVDYIIRAAIHAR